MTPPSSADVVTVTFHGIQRATRGTTAYVGRYDGLTHNLGEYLVCSLLAPTGNTFALGFQNTRGVFAPLLASQFLGSGASIELMLVT